MKLVVVAVGRLKSGPERALCERYSERIAPVLKPCGIQDVRLVELSESHQRRPDDRMTEELRAIDAALPDGARRIVLDERGKTVDSVEFARLIQSFREAGAATLGLVIGGPDGLDPACRARADLVLSFGKLTLPHQLVRVLVLEQLYRAGTILTGHPYHRV
jgi:23S rRNA (pseudouridine1915-N3)-methyltransferase